MLETIELPGTGRRTTRLGFGGSGLMGGMSERESLRLLETAFDAGIRHFDVAPSYGHGMAERCLGKFVRGKAGVVTVATKYGILPPRHAGLLEFARTAVRPFARRLPSFRKRLARAASGLKSKTYFSAEEARNSLEHSLRELGVDRIDLFLLHEATADDLDAADLLCPLQQMRQEGRIGMYGIGSERGSLEALRRRYPDYCRVLQFEWSVLDDKTDFPGAFCIHHRAISGALGAIREHFERDCGLCRRWSDAVDADLTSPETLAGCLLTASLVLNPNGVVLFSSRVPAHIRSNVRLAGDPAWAARSQRLLELIRNPPIASA
jgi:D-threo-aldose 1-dehydrogenase